MMDYQYIIFDLDGTLLDSGPYLNKILCLTLEHEGFGDLVSDELVERFVGVPLYEGFVELCGMNEAECDRCVDYFGKLYKKLAPAESHALSGVGDMLKALKESGKTLAVATNGATDNARLILKCCDLDQYFSCIYGLKSLGAPETKKDVIMRVIDSLGIEALDKAIMVGDRDFDVRAARACELETIGILHGGYGTREELEDAGAKYVVDDSAGLIELLLN